MGLYGKPVFKDYPSLPRNLREYGVACELADIALEAEKQNDLSNYERFKALADTAMHELFPGTITKESIGD